MSSQKKSDCLTVEAWDPKAVLFQQPKKSKLGKDINVISAQLNSKLTLQSPLMKTWGIADFVDEKTGESDGKFSMSLNFPNSDYGTPSTTEFLEKMICLFRLDFIDEAAVAKAQAGKPVYLGIAMNDAQELKLKPQNLLFNLPLAKTS